MGVTAITTLYTFIFIIIIIINYLHNGDTHGTMNKGDTGTKCSYSCYPPQTTHAALIAFFPKFYLKLENFMLTSGYCRLSYFYNSPFLMKTLNSKPVDCAFYWT